MTPKNVNDRNVLEITRHIGTWITDEQKFELFRLGSAVKPGERIIEIGGLYGGTAALLGLASPKSHITVIDNFSWTPPDCPVPSKKFLLDNIASVGVNNVTVIEMDSMNCEYHADDKPIAFLFVDGGHTYEECKHDLETFGPFSRVIAVHDYTNGHLPGVKQATDEFISSRQSHSLDRLVESLAILEPVPHAND